jgi:hypothetical protein
MPPILRQRRRVGSGEVVKLGPGAREGDALLALICAGIVDKINSQGTYIYPVPS